MPHRSAGPLTLLLTLAAAPTAPAADPGPWLPDRAGYDKTVAPFFAAHCNKCHTGEKPKGDFGPDPGGLPNDFADPAGRAKWREVVNVLNSHEMPPKQEKQPEAAAVAA